jgi:hypothetical protein
MDRNRFYITPPQFPGNIIKTQYMVLTVKSFDFVSPRSVVKSHMKM